MEKIIIILSGIILAIASFVIFKTPPEKKLLTPIKNIEKAKPLEKYSFENLRKRRFEGSEITISSDIFYFYTDGKKVSGLLNIPPKGKELPVIILLRGYVDKETYTTGEGTRKVGQTLAKHGFVTLAPDFLGYGDSDNPSESSIEARFQTYTTVLTLLASIKNLEKSLKNINGSVSINENQIGIWGHSNGGQIALSILEITGKNYPTVLWAPVSKPFPYSILYYTDEFEDYGKALRKVLAEFEKDYDVDDFNPTNYFKWINAPIQIHQGEADEAVPLKWSNNLVETLKSINKEIEYYTYPGADHNLKPNAWNTAVSRSISFYRKKM